MLWGNNKLTITSQVFVENNNPFPVFCDKHDRNLETINVIPIFPFSYPIYVD